MYRCDEPEWKSSDREDSFLSLVSGQSRTSPHRTSYVSGLTILAGSDYKGTLHFTNRIKLILGGGTLSIKSPEELAGLRVAGAIVRRMLAVMKQAVRPGITTAELDEVGGK